jgi:endonuclease YncB( thermonuclease family)
MTDEGSDSERVSQTRRRFMQALGSAGVGTAVGSVGAAADQRPTDIDTDDLDEVEGTVGALSFYSPASQLNTNKEPLADDDVALVRAEPTAFNFETTSDGPPWAPVLYGEDDPAIPLVSQDTDDPVVGFGTIDFVKDTTGGFRNDNEMVMLNLFDDLVGPGSLVAFDESHQIIQSLDDYQSFSAYAESAGYEMRASGDLLTSGLTFRSTASQIAPNGTDPLTNSDNIVVWAESTAENVDDESDGAVIYPEDTDIPLVSRDGDVFGFGTPELIEGKKDEQNPDITRNNEQFLLNVLEDTIGKSGTVVWDDAHGTFWSSDKFSVFTDTIGDEGYEFLSSGDDIRLGPESKLEFAGVSSLVDRENEGDELLFTDENKTAVWAEGTATNLGISEPLVVDDDTTGETTTHAWLFDTVSFGGEVDTITVDYPEHPDPEKAIFDGLDETNITVFLFRELSSGPELTEIPVNSTGETDIGGSTATFDISGVFDTNVVGPVVVRIDGLTNPDQTDYTATVTFEAVDSAIDPLTVEASPARDDDGTLEGSVETLPYPDQFDIPLLGVDGEVLGVGADFVSDSAGTATNRTVLLNAWEDRLNGTGTVKYDESHGQNRTLAEDYTSLVEDAENRGFTVEAIAEGEDFETALDGADAVMLAGDDGGLDAFTESERGALGNFVETNGGGLFVHDTSFVGGDSTGVLNEVLAAVGADFQFNTDRVIDEENNVLGPSLPRTGNFNEDEYGPFFSGLDGQTGSIGSADVVVIPSPSQAYTQPELDALTAHVDNGGAVFLFDESEFQNEETANLNGIADALDLAFRFNPDQVEDTENGLGHEGFPLSYIPQTKNFNESFPLFDGLDAVGLPDVDGVMITTPFFSFTDLELGVLSEFVDNGGAVFLFDQSDFGGQGEDEDGFDETANMNDIAEALDLDFRFNSDQVNDETYNTGSVFDPLTANYDATTEDPGVFEKREDGIGIEFDQSEEYYAQVVEVVDGDTFVVEFDTEYGYRDTVRHLGMDTAETGGGNDPKEWFGIPDGEDQVAHLDMWGENATGFALEKMAPDGADAEEEIQGRSVRIRFDENEPARGGFGRLLSYMDYDPENFDADPETGTFDAEYNKQTVEEGYARVYSSGFGRHDEFAAAEETALANGTGVWSASDFDAITEYRTDFVDDVFVPRASSVTTADGPLGGDGSEGDRPTPILRASESAEQEPLGEDSFDEYDGLPVLAGVDIDSGVGMFGGQLLEESYEAGEDDDITGEFALGEAGNFTLFTNAVELLSDTDGPILIEGGHGQFGVDGGATLEDLKFYLRHVEGLSGQIAGNARLRQVNDLEETLPELDARAVILTAAGREYTDAELDALSTFRDGGGAVLLVGSAAPDPAERTRLNTIAEALGADLRLNDDRVIDEGGPISDPGLLVTENVDTAHGLRMPVHLDREIDGMGVMAALDVLDNDDGGTAWALAASSEGVAQTDEQNPTMRFKIGERHYIENRGWGNDYPLAFRDADDNILLGQTESGSFEDDPDVEWVDTGDVVEFTLTEDLAAEIDGYVCPVAQPMNGDVLALDRIVGPPQLDAAFAGPPRDLDGDGLFEDVNGDGRFDIFDVQAFFETFERETVQQNTAFFKFNSLSDNPDEINILDVQALFQRL